MEIHYQMSEKPKKAGLAFLEYLDLKEPKRTEDKIEIPDSGFGIYQLIPDFSQFLLIATEPEPKNSSSYPDIFQAWFGGTDERPFLVRLETQSWPNIWQKQDFFEVIKPLPIRNLEQSYGNKTKRQGDMFCYPMPIQGDKLFAILSTIKEHLNYRTVKDWPLYDTRHCINGDIAPWGDNVIAKGLVRAPDHTDLLLRNYHVIAQTRFLDNPEKAD